MDFILEVTDDMTAAFERGSIETPHGLEWRSLRKDGYGVCSWTTDGFSIQVRAYRVGWMLENGPIPPGYDIDHDPACPKSCVTASHLQALPRADHARLGWERGELNGGWGTKRTRIHPPKPEPFIWQVERPCLNCGVFFLPGQATQVHCDRDCAVKYKQALRAPRRYPRPDTRICAWPSCSSTFKPKRKDSNFCSRKCIEQDQYNKTKLRKLQLNQTLSHEE